MKIIFTFFIAFLFCSISINAQDEDFWSLVLETGDSPIRFIEVSKNNPMDYVAVVTEKNEIFLSTDLGATWSDIHTGLPQGEILSLALSSVFYVVIENEGIYVSDDIGYNWVKSDNGIEGLRIKKVAAKGNIIFVQTEDEIYFSRDNAVTWVLVEDIPETSQIQNIFGDLPYGFYVQFDNNSLWSYYYFKSEWELESLGEAIPQIKNLVQSNDKLFALTENLRIFSKEYEREWTQVEIPDEFEITKISAHDIVEVALTGEYGDYLNSRIEILCGTENSGVYGYGESYPYSFQDNSGLNSDLSISAVNVIETYLDGWVSFVGSSKGNVYRNKGYAPVSVEGENDNELFMDIRQNDHSEAIEINFFIQHPGIVNIEVYDVLGNLVGRIANSYYDSGSHSIKYSTVQLPSGSYYVKLNAGGRSIIDKFILLN